MCAVLCNDTVCANAMCMIDRVVLCTASSVKRLFNIVSSLARSLAAAAVRVTLILPITLCDMHRIESVVSFTVIHSDQFYCCSSLVNVQFFSLSFSFFLSCRPNMCIAQVPGEDCRLLHRWYVHTSNELNQI